MTSPGIEVRPLVLSTGDPEFGEVYFDEVEVPAENLLGPLHGGWKIAMHTLAHERGWYGVGRQVILRVLLDRLIEEAHARVTRDGRPAIEDPAIRSRAGAGPHRARGRSSTRGYAASARCWPTDTLGSRARSTRSSWPGSSSG